MAVAGGAGLALYLLEFWVLVVQQDTLDHELATLLPGFLEEHVLELWEVEQDLPLAPLAGQHLLGLEVLGCGLVDAPALVRLAGNNALANGPICGTPGPGDWGSSGGSDSMTLPGSTGRSGGPNP